MFSDSPVLTHYICPITNVPLMRLPHDMSVMDGDAFFYSTSNPDIKWARHPFQFNIFRLVDSFYHCAPGRRFFKYENDGSWTEMIENEELKELVPINISLEEIEELLDKKKRRWIEQSTPSEYSINLPLAKQVFPTLEHSEIVTVQPMSSPQGLINYMDFKMTETPKLSIWKRIVNFFKL